MSRAGFNLNANVASVVRGKGVGMAGDGNVLSRPCRLYHRLNVPKAGIGRYTFFNEAKGLGISNLDQPGTLPANNVFVALGIRFSFLPGMDRLGLRLGLSAPSAAELQASSLNYGSSTTAAVVTATVDALAAIWKWHEKVREILSQGEALFKIGDRTMFQVYGLDAMPSGRGVVASAQSDVSVGVSNTTATTITIQSLQHALTQISNGAPVVGNIFKFSSPIAIVAGQQFSVELAYNANVDFTEQYLGPLYGLANAVSAGTLMCELDGEMITPVQ